jgi:hypothetical protein
MKKISCLLTCIVTFIVLNANAQTKETTNKVKRQNDVMISPLELIITPLLNISYERLINENSGIGLNVLAYLGGDEYDTGFSQFSPYYRMYFGQKYASGFFVEGFLPVTTTHDVYYLYNGGSSISTQRRTTLGAGIGLGGKWIAKRNIVFEASFGMGRRFGSATPTGGNNFDQDFNITGKGMLGIGYRF